MNADARPKQFPPPSLTSRAVGQPRIPGHRHRHDPTVSKLDDERAISDANVLGRRCFRRND
jgi:hypothetical protein